MRIINIQSQAIRQIHNPILSVSSLQQPQDIIKPTFTIITHPTDVILYLSLDVNCVRHQTKIDYKTESIFILHVEKETDPIYAPVADIDRYLFADMLQAAIGHTRVLLLEAVRGTKAEGTILDFEPTMILLNKVKTAIFEAMPTN